MIPLPREHGAWAMLAISLLAGWWAGGLTPPVLTTSVSVVAAFLAQAAWLEFRSGRNGALPFLVESSVAAGAFTLAASTSSAILAVGAIMATVGVAAGILRVRGTNSGGRVGLDSWGAHFAGALALAGVAPLLCAASMEPLDLLRLWLGFAGSFASGVLLVRTLRGAGASSIPLLVWSLATFNSWLLLGTDAPVAVALAWIPIPLRWLLLGPLRRKRLGWRALGLLETALGAWSALWTIVSMR